jgi:hypothetical protein
VIKLMRQAGIGQDAAAAPKKTATSRTRKTSAKAGAKTTEAKAAK